MVRDMAENDNKRVRFEQLSLQDEEEYADFLAAAYKGRPNYGRFSDRDAVKKFWRWKYIDNPNASGDRPLIWLCRLEGRVVAQTCLMPVSLKIGIGVCRAGWYQDFVVLPEFRGQGLGSLLVEHVTEDAKNYLDVLLVAGTNKISYAIFKKSGFSDIGFVGRNVMVARMAPLFRLFRIFAKSSRQRGEVKITETGALGREFDDFWLSVSKSFPNIVKRDAETLKWRFIDQPWRDYRILIAESNGTLKGYAAISQGRVFKGRLGNLRMGIVSDILFDPKEKHIGLSLLEAAVKYLSKGCDIVRCDILCRGVEPVIRSAGFMPIKSNNRFLAKPLNEEMGYGDMIGPDKKLWHLTYGDSDLDLF